MSNSDKDTRRLAVECFVSRLTNAGWQLENGPDWAADFEQGIELEATLRSERGDLCLTFPPRPNHISILISDEKIGVFFEFGFDYEGVKRLEDALDHIVNWQVQLSYDNYPEFIELLHKVCKRIDWEVQGNVEERIDESNITSSKYIRRIPSQS